MNGKKMIEIKNSKKETEQHEITVKGTVYYIIKKEYATIEVIQDALCFGADFICSNGNIYTNL